METPPAKGSGGMCLFPTLRPSLKAVRLSVLIDQDRIAIRVNHHKAGRTFVTVLLLGYHQSSGREL